MVADESCAHLVLAWWDYRSDWFSDGVLLSYPLGWSVRATIIVVLGVFFVAAYVCSPKHGLFRRRRRVA